MRFRTHKHLNRAAKASNPALGSASDESVVIAAAKNGEEASFELLIGRYERKILRRAMLITRNWEDAEDVKQQCIIKAFTHLHSFQGNSSFSTWLIRIAINEALMLLRKKRSWHEVAMETACDPEGEIEARQNLPDNPLPDEPYLAEERKQILLAALQELTPSMRMAIQLRELEERSTKETAQMLGISIGATKSRLFNGWRKLREVLDRDPRTRGMWRTELRRNRRSTRCARIVDNAYHRPKKPPFCKTISHREGTFPFPMGRGIENCGAAFDRRI